MQDSKKVLARIRQDPNGNGKKYPKMYYFFKSHFIDLEKTSIYGNTSPPFL
jgi:hypothetical protein